MEHFNYTKPKGQINLVVGITGSVAAIKTKELVHHLIHDIPQHISSVTKVALKLVPTQKAISFFVPEQVSHEYYGAGQNVETNKGQSSPYDIIYSEHPLILRDTNEWDSWKNRGDPILHIELGKWADALLIAPLDANTLAKIAAGLADNFLTCLVRAWDISSSDKTNQKPVILAPAMNSKMWDHPLTKKHIEIVRDLLHFEIISPISKTLMCGDEGLGAMEEPKMIVSHVIDLLRRNNY